jgi:para-aminobenzoate N-oxygenase AurF
MTATDDVTTGDADETPTDSYVDRVEALSHATTRLRFDPYTDIDWEATENALDKNDPRWVLDPATAPLAATDWYAEQPLQRRIDMGRWITANTFKVGIQFEMILIRGVVHYAGKLRNADPVFRYLMHEVTDECNHIQMFQEFINRNDQDVPGMRRMSRIVGPIVGFISGYLRIMLFIGVLCGEQPVHFQQTLLQRRAARLPPLLNKITYIHLAEEARHITFADDHLAEHIKYSGRFRRMAYAVLFPLFLRWLMGEIITPPRSFARQFGVPRRTFKSAYWRSEHSRRMMSESAADARRVADHLGLRTVWSRQIWRVLGIEGRVPRYRGEPNRRFESLSVAQLVEIRTTMWLRVAAALAMTAVAFLATPVGWRITLVAAAGAGVWALYHALRERVGGMMGNQPFEWPRLFVWVAVCVIMIPTGGLIGLALVVFMILALAEFMPTL